MRKTLTLADCKGAPGRFGAPLFPEPAEVPAPVYRKPDPRALLTPRPEVVERRHGDRRLHSHIRERCDEWADWLLSPDGHGLGFPRQCNFSRLTPGSDRAPLDRIYETDNCLTLLAAREMRLYQALVEWHTGRGSDLEMAARCHCELDEFKHRLERGYSRLAELLQHPPMRRRLS